MSEIENMMKPYASDLWITAMELDGKQFSARIVGVRLATKLMLPNGSPSKDKIAFALARLNGQPITKELLVCKTNMQALIKEVGSKKSSDLIGKTVCVYPTTTKVQGKTIEVVRVKLIDAPSTTAPTQPATEPAPAGEVKKEVQS
jgi:hypothetical protein